MLGVRPLEAPAFRHGESSQSEHQRERRQLAQARTGSVSLAPVILLFVGIIALLLFQRLQSRLPLWVRQALTALFQGKAPQLTAAETATLWQWGIGLIIVVLVLLFGSVALRRAFTRQTPLYDPQLVREKTARLAYRARLRLFVIGPRSSAAPLGPAPLLPGDVSARQALPNLAVYYRDQCRRAWQCWERRVRHWRQHPPSLTQAGVILWRLVRWRWLGMRRAWQAQCRRRQDQRSLTQARWQAAELLVGAYRQFHLATGAYFIPRRIWRGRARTLVAGHGWWRGWMAGVVRSAHLLSVADIAALWHLPQAEDLPDLGQIARTRARTRLVPAAMTQEGYLLGTSSHAGRTLPVRFPASALIRNAVAVAKSGKGKSTLLLAFALAALTDPASGLFALDPHGDLADAILAQIPPDRRADVILIDLAESGFPVGLNPLDVTAYPDRDAVVSQLIAVCSKIWESTWGSRMEAAFEMALKTLYEANQAIVARDPQAGPDEQYTLLDVGPILSVHGVRVAILDDVRDPVIHAWWSEQFDTKTHRDKVEMISPVLTKMNKFAASLVARRIVGQSRTTVDFAAAMRAGKILIVRSAQGVVGTDVAAILGATILGLVGTTMLAQANLPVAQRHRMRFIIDEFQTLPGVDWSKWLSELRKYGGSFALATQALAHLDKLDAQLRPQVWANIEQIFAFGMAADDARIIERELDGVVDSTDLINLDDFEMYVKSSVEGQRQPVFSMRLHPPPAPDDHAATLMRASCRARYGTPVARVDAAINAAIEEHMEFVREAEDAAAEAATKKAAAKQRGKTATQNTARRPTSNAPAPAPTAQSPAPSLPPVDTSSGDAAPTSGKLRRRSGKSERKRRDPAAWHGETPVLVQGQLAPARELREADEHEPATAEDADREEAEV